MRKLTPLMIEVLLWLGARLTGETPRGVDNARLSTWTGLVDRGLITEYRQPVCNKRGRLVPGGHALTTDGLRWLTQNAPSEMRRNAARQLVVDAAHFAALANEAEDGNEANTLHAEAWAAEYAAGSLAPFTIEQGPRPAALEYAGSHVFRPGARQWNGIVRADRCAFPDCNAGEDVSVHVATNLPVRVPGASRVSCGVTARDGADNGVVGDYCLHDADHAGNHSWAPADLATCSTAEQRAALAADHLHAEKTTAGKLTAALAAKAGSVFDDVVLRSADAVSVPDDEPIPAAEPGVCTFFGLISKSPCTLPAGHHGRHLLAKDVPVQDGVIEPHGAPDVFTVYRADRRWTYVGPGGLFRLAGGDGTIDVYAVAVPGMPGRFTLMMLNRVIADVERAPDGFWRPVDGS